MPVTSAEDWFKGLGPISKLTFVIAIVLSVTIQFGYLTYHQIILDFNAVLQNFQVWRLLTNLLWWGPWGVPTALNFFFFVRYTVQLEHDEFRGRTADHLWMMVFTCTCLTVCGFLLSIPLLSHALLMSLVWIWCRKNAEAQVNLGFPMPAPWFPWILFGLHLLLGVGFVDDFAGIVCGHIYYFTNDVMPYTHGYTFFKTPPFLYNLITPRTYGYRAAPMGAGRPVGAG